MADDWQVQFGASIGALVEGIEGIKDKLTEITAPIQSLKGAFEELQEAMIAAFAVHEVEEFFEKFAEFGQKTIDTAIELGTTSTKVQQLGFIARATGSSQEALTMAMVRMQYSLQ